MTQVQIYKPEDGARISRLHKAYADSSQFQGLFASRDAFVKHMLKAEYDSTPSLQAEFPSSETFAAFAIRAPLA
jgi:hypothetical protein